MQYVPPRFFFVLSLVAVFFHAGAVFNGVPGARENGIPETIGRVADPNIESAEPVVRAQPALLQEPQAAAGMEALTMIRFPWQDLGYQVSFRGRRPGYRALTLVDKHEIEVYVKTEEKPDALAFDLAHEFGHVVDMKYNDEARRKQWMELRGIDPATQWYGCSACSDYDTPAGDFAETFAYLLLGPGSYHSRMAPPPPPEKVRELADFCHIKEVASVLRTAR